MLPLAADHRQLAILKLITFRAEKPVAQQTSRLPNRYSPANLTLNPCFTFEAGRAAAWALLFCSAEELWVWLMDWWDSTTHGLPDRRTQDEQAWPSNAEVRLLLSEPGADGQNRGVPSVPASREHRLDSNDPPSLE